MSRDNSMIMDDTGFLTGQLLIAMPGIGDPRFERALIYVCIHDETHAVGLAVNRPVEGLTVPDLLQRLEIEAAIAVPESLVLMGGPVQRERGFVLHTDDYKAAEGTVEIGEGVALTATREALEAMAGQIPPPRRSILALGYSGWGAGQLEREIRENVWLTCASDETLLFGDDYGHKWNMALAKLGVDPGLLTATAGRA
ncbi:YqgE/AlgH family protein [Phenylobacterium aquaticum]|uniref:YqgE/AlgH family protein n=1 Tax=Phenylobacterium aquaticum TaxID=1763816 RepID=UPI001F5C3B1A|nr:YqgE/AlgH family protein [Phenylobacterium aquaticum]MCI3133656.1 YqgE/AlgH family protein [Phenylobacterium aquaticum]